MVYIIQLVRPRGFCKVYTVEFWMALLGAETCKRTKMMGNFPSMGGLDLGKLTKGLRQKKLKTKTTRPLASS